MSRNWNKRRRNSRPAGRRDFRPCQARWLGRPPAKRAPQRCSERAAALAPHLIILTGTGCRERWDGPAPTGGLLKAIAFAVHLEDMDAMGQAMCFGAVFCPPLGVQR
jgi:hypothetical protein